MLLACDGEKLDQLETLIVLSIEPKANGSDFSDKKNIHIHGSISSFPHSDCRPPLKISKSSTTIANELAFCELDQSGGLIKCEINRHPPSNRHGHSHVSMNEVCLDAKVKHRTARSLSSCGVKLPNTKIRPRRSRSASVSADNGCLRCLVGQIRLQEEVFTESEFEVVATIGRGFYGVASKVFHKKSGRVLVLKQMANSEATCMKTFKQELLLLRQIRHRHVIGFVGVNFSTGNSISFVVEYMSNGSLNKLIHNHEINIGWARRIGFARDIALGMRYLHSLNVIHRDLNSHNCLLRADNSVVIADFGLSYIAADDGMTNATHVRGAHIDGDILRVHERYNIVGSPYWMAPEMLKNQMYDEKVDVFSFGIVLCEIIGRIEADPDYLPRTSDFGLNVLLFKQNLCSKDCPKRFLEITVNCCDILPDVRPSFASLAPKLRALRFSTSED